MVIAEKAADLILGNTPQPAASVPFCTRATSGNPGAAH
jgi:hypothetical protein